MKRLLKFATAPRASLVAAIVVAASILGAAAKEPLSILGVQIPDQVAGIPHAPPHNFEKDHPGLGYSIEFQRPDWRIHVYIYDLRMTSIPADPKSDAVKQQLAQASGDISEMERRGNYSNVTAKGQYTVNDGAGRTRFVCSAFSYFIKERKIDADSYLCVTSVKNKFFKIRMTTKQGPASSVDARRFVQAWADALWP